MPTNDSPILNRPVTLRVVTRTQTGTKTGIPVYSYTNTDTNVWARIVEDEGEAENITFGGAVTPLQRGTDILSRADITVRYFPTEPSFVIDDLGRTWEVLSSRHIMFRRYTTFACERLVTTYKGE